jgi:hypothetical protein
MKNLLTIALLLIQTLLVAQNHTYTKTSLIADLTYLDKALQKAHPINYKRADKITIQPFIDSIEKTLPATFSWRAYEWILREGIAKIGCVHTAIFSVPKEHITAVAPTRFYPLSMFDFQSLQDTLGIAVGDVITRINGISQRDLAHKMLHFMGGDGHSTALSRELMNANFPIMLYRNVGQVDTFDVEINGEKHIKMVAKPLKKNYRRNTPQYPILYSSKTDTLFENGKTVIWKITSFHRKSKENKAVFDILKAKKMDNVVFDFRGNLGGNFTVGGDLLRYFVREAATFRMQGGYKGSRYLDTKSKLTTLPLGLLMYEIFRLPQKRYKGGKHWFYKYAPHTDAFQGKITVLIDGYTASTASQVASFLKHKAGATLVGTPSVGGETDNNGGLFPKITLPKSKVRIRFPMKQLVYDMTKTPQNIALNPHILVTYTAQDIVLGKDIALEKALEILK